MPRVSPFRGLLYDAARVGSLDSVTAPPYDMVDERMRLRLEAQSPYNVVRLDLGDAAGEGSARYERAAELLERWREDGTLRQEPRPALYPYEMRFPWGGGDQKIRGVICLVRLEPLGEHIVPHERTMPAPVQDRLRLLRAMPANLSPVYAVFGGPDPAVSESLETVMITPPLVRVADDEGVEHRLWSAAPGVVTLPEAEPLLIADGHHRTTTALRYQQEMHEAHGRGPWDDLMMLLVDGDQERPPVLPYHRVVLRGSVSAPGEHVTDLTNLLDRIDDETMTCGIVRIGEKGPEYVVTRLSGTPPVVAAVHEQLLGGVEALRYTPDAAAAEHDVLRGHAAAAIVLPPTSTRRIREVIERGAQLPEKSTFFWPKPRTGMVMRVLEPD